MINSIASSPVSLFRTLAPGERGGGQVGRAGNRETLVAGDAGHAAETGGVVEKAHRAAAISATATESGLSAEELRLIDALSATDRQVRTHELAHMAAGAGLTGGASFSYQLGPDNQRYAVGGEVSIDTSPAGDPAATIAKAQQIRAAALAPADPSPQDQKVAAMAAQMASAARAQLAAQEQEQSGQQSEPRVSAVAAAYQAIAEGGSSSSAGFSAVA